MSRVVWAVAREPRDAAVEPRAYEAYDPPLVVPRTRAFPASDHALVALPDRRAYRALARSGLLLVSVGLEAASALAETLAADPYRVGIYCALDAGPQNYEAARDLLDAGGGLAEGFAEGFRKRNHPKRYFTQLVNLPAAHLGIFLDVRGPIDVYSHSWAAAFHALDQAEVDLASAVVDAALVVGAFSLEDPLLTARAHRRAPDAVISEAAAALVLRPGGAPLCEALADPGALDEPPPFATSSGIVDPLLRLAREHAPYND